MDTTEKNTTRYLYGLTGIMNEFGVSKGTARKYKDGVLRPAVAQYGRVILVDANKAHELFANAGKVAKMEGEV